MQKLTIRKKLGRTGLEVPLIIYGSSYLGNLYREISEEVKTRIVEQWFACTTKPVVIDSAGKYGAGLALEMIGKLLDKLNVDPEDVLISNKLGWYRVPLTAQEPTFEAGVWAGLKYDAIQKISYQGILDCWEQGSELLGKKYKTSLVSVHDPDEYLHSASSPEERQQKLQDILGAYKALFELKEEGIVKGVGIGAKDWRVIKELSEYLDFDWIMMSNKFTIYYHPKEVLDFIEEQYGKGTGIINAAIFNAGFLTGGTYFDYVKVDPHDPAYRELFAWRTKFHKICDSFNIAPAEACVKFALSHPAISAIALNTSKPEKVCDNVKTVNKDIPETFWQALKEEKVIDPDYSYI